MHKCQYLAIVLVEDDNREGLYWACLFDRSMNERWRSRAAQEILDARAYATTARKTFESGEVPLPPLP